MNRSAKRELVFQLVETSRHLRTYVDQRAKNSGTTRAQWGVLARLRREEGLMQVDLAELLEMQPISLARLIDRLEEQRYVERRPDPKDRRAYRLYLTDEGRVFVDSLDPLREDIAAELLDDVDDATVAAMNDLLATMKQRMKPDTDPVDGEGGMDLTSSAPRQRGATAGTDS